MDGFAIPGLEAVATWATGVYSAMAAGMLWVHERPVLGSLVAFGSLLFILLVIRVQNRNTATSVRQYRHYEIALIVRNKLSVHRLVDYHRGIAWRDFAAISTGSGIAGAALMFSNSSDVIPILAGASSEGGLSSEAIVILIASVAVQVASAIVMMICDFIHTNTLSPIVPPLQRMRIVGEATVLGGGAMIFNIAALISFLAVFSPWVSIFCSIVFAVAVIRLTALRAIEVDELLKWVKMKAGAEWDAIDAEVRTLKRRARDLSVREAYQANWADHFEDPCRE